MSLPTPALSPDSFDRFGPLLRYLRVRARLAQRDLAIAVGYSEAHISRLEQGQRRPDIDTVRARFIDALALADDPAWAARLLALSAAEEAADAPAPAPTAPVPAPAPPSAEGLIATKLYRPHPRSGALARERLLTRLDGALDVPLTLVSAPAGFGKSTLIAGWLAGVERRGDAEPHRRAAAWLSLDAGDNELIVFLRYLVAALRPAAPGIGADTLALLAAPETPPLRALLTPLVNDLAALPHHVILALDDYHLISNGAIHAAVDFLLERTQPRLHLVLATRTDPPLALARLRVRGQLIELRAPDLRFTLAEATWFLQHTMGLGVSNADAALLEARTEGWAAGLQLAALALREQVDRPTFVASFAGSNHYVLDYLAEEVLDRLPTHLRSFLLQTSILDRLCGELCDAVFGLDAEQGPGEGARSARDSYSQRILSELERLNLFLAPLDGERQWYRYHPLFADVLRERLRSGTRPEQVLALHRRASDWLWRRGLPAEAIACALAGPDHELAAARIESVSRQMLGRGESVTLLQWVGALPDGLLKARPALALAYAWALFHTNQWNAIEPHLARAEAALLAAEPDPGATANPLAAEIVALRGCISAHRGDARRAIELCELALRELPADDLRLRSALHIALGTANYVTGRVAEAVQASRAAVVIGARGRYLFPTIHAHYYGMAGQLTLCDIAEVSAHYQEARRFAAQMGSPQSPALGMVLVMQGRAAYEQDRLAEAGDYLREALERCRQLGYPEALADAHTSYARLACALGDPAGVREHLRQAAQIVRDSEVHPFFVAEFACMQITLLIAGGAIDEAEAAARGLGLSEQLAIDFKQYPAIIGVGRLALARGRPAAAVGLIAPLLDLDGVADLPGLQLDALVPLARALHAAGAEGRALEALGRALAIAERVSFTRIFLNEGQPMRDLLGLARARGLSPAFCDRLLAAFAARP